MRSTTAVDDQHILHPDDERQAQAQPSDEEIDAIAEGMPGGLDGFLKQWGWRQFARALLSRYGAGQPAASAEPLRVFAQECAMGAYQESELREAALRALKYATAPVSAEPVAVVKDNNHCPEGTSDEISVYLPVGMNLYAAPAAAQAQQNGDVKYYYCDRCSMTLGDELVSEIANDFIQAQQPVSGADGLPDGYGWDDGENPPNKLLYQCMAPFHLNLCRGQELRSVIDYGRLVWKQSLAKQEAEHANHWKVTPHSVSYLTDHAGLIEIKARDEATCNAALDAVRDALAPVPARQDADKVDAERYRAWRSMMLKEYPGITCHLSEFLPFGATVFRHPTPDEWDAAIDAARAAKGE